jgi:hypothetical protein
MPVIEIGLLVAILIVLIAILTAMKFRFNQVIKRLEAVSDRSDRSR